MSDPKERLERAENKNLIIRRTLTIPILVHVLRYSVDSITSNTDAIISFIHIGVKASR